MWKKAIRSGPSPFLWLLLKMHFQWLLVVFIIKHLNFSYVFTIKINVTPKITVELTFFRGFRKVFEREIYIQRSLGLQLWSGNLAALICEMSDVHGTFYSLISSKNTCDISQKRFLTFSKSACQFYPFHSLFKTLLRLRSTQSLIRNQKSPNSKAIMKRDLIAWKMWL